MHLLLSIFYLICLYPYLIDAIRARIANGTGQHLWCHVGGQRRAYDYGPQQCEVGISECFKFTCTGGQHEFTVRGCGLSVFTKATGLKNESCFQAMSVCQYLSGESECDVCGNKHMCNSSPNYQLHKLSIGFMLLTTVLFWR